ncbi:unnamed protein product [Amoebophrya sp. A120]|nr:unnamed protein product [Amoebophrya sp. A120]|eukprot:GSA120T00024663001.1
MCQFVGFALLLIYTAVFWLVAFLSPPSSEVDGSYSTVLEAVSTLELDVGTSGAKIEGETSTTFGTAAAAAGKASAIDRAEQVSAATKAEPTFSTRGVQRTTSASELSPGKLAERFLNDFPVLNVSLGVLLTSIFYSSKLFFISAS